MPAPEQAQSRILALSAHLTSTPPPTSTKPSMSTPARPPITCHVLDTTLGLPAPSIPVTLTLHPSPTSTSLSPTTTPQKFTATTNADGRVTEWTPSSPFATDSLEDVFSRPEDQMYSLLFDTGAYFGGRGVKAFFPEVEVRFLVRGEVKGEHFHVPVLLGPFGYTTYRGS
ncbi:Hydroxyisourate hydrolase [Dothidotthia symphoricarpi CBS 119687]|uniref:hydroxyisourate hydrolase n=1 Tax=Dothidotthia symphoricarpi CBS 119687 TaxID=1392245 RepID=A0A6A6ARH4_9PLEO|nr:Hydroxyisourate hydrolase [Dothidotthia symphoricarpi CBS 119687]KAF2133813.1 Hydroxyisourate hydrolase [Dothidotthia symphoricarpi CBS 119687]